MVDVIMIDSSYDDDEDANGIILLPLLRILYFYIMS